jgi:hypothetical protein
VKVGRNTVGLENIVNVKWGLGDVDWINLAQNRDKW